jgi:hypothetical protein
MIWPFRRRRLLFRYFNGEKWVAADPLPIYRRLRAEADRLVVLATAWDEQRHPEANEFVDLVSEIFALKAFDPDTEKGLTETEIVQVFAEFDLFLKEVRDRFFSGSTLSGSGAGMCSTAAARK